jgi:hypothetical protein
LRYPEIRRVQDPTYNSVSETISRGPKTRKNGPEVLGILLREQTRDVLKYERVGLNSRDYLVDAT